MIELNPSELMSLIAEQYRELDESTKEVQYLKLYSRELKHTHCESNLGL